SLEKYELVQPHQSRHNDKRHSFAGKVRSHNHIRPATKKKSSQPRRKSTMLQPHQSRHNEETPQLCWKSTEIHYYHQSKRRAFQHLKPKKSISCIELFIWKGDSQSDCHTHRTCRKRRHRQYQTPVECRPPPPKI
ncbi:unnamed protein product, partial [Brassica oleracea var. botrytis]